MGEAHCNTLVYVPGRLDNFVKLLPGCKTVPKFFAVRNKFPRGSIFKAFYVKMDSAPGDKMISYSF